MEAGSAQEGSGCAAEGADYTINRFCIIHLLKHCTAHLDTIKPRSKKRGSGGGAGAELKFAVLRQKVESGGRPAS